MGNLGFFETLATISGDGTALTAAARASLLQGAGGKQGLYKLPQNSLKINDVLAIDAMCRISQVVTTPGTARFDLSAGVGGTAIMDSLAIPLNIVAKTNVMMILHMEGIVRAIGSTANIFWYGWWLSEAALNVPLPSVGPGPGGNTLPYNTPPVVGANFDHSIDQILDLNWTQTVATGSAQLHAYRLSKATSFGS